MLPVTKANPFNPAIGAGGLVVNNSSRYFMSCWIATARNCDFQDGGPRGNKIDLSTRTATNCYMVGLKENVKIETATSKPYTWRRICFTFNASLSLLRDTGTALEAAAWAETSSGYKRAIVQLLPDTPNPLYDNIQQILFKGVVNEDWNDFITAPVDTSRVTVKYDKVHRISSGNDAGVNRMYRKWHPMNKTIVYNDDEEGGGRLTPYLSAGTRRSMGDYWVVDIFDNGPTAGSENDRLFFTPHATLYWHER